SQTCPLPRSPPPFARRTIATASPASLRSRTTLRRSRFRGASSKSSADSRRRRASVTSEAVVVAIRPTSGRWREGWRIPNESRSSRREEAHFKSLTGSAGLKHLWSWFVQESLLSVSSASSVVQTNCRFGFFQSEPPHVGCYNRRHEHLNSPGRPRSQRRCDGVPGQ